MTDWRVGSIRDWRFERLAIRGRAADRDKATSLANADEDEFLNFLQVCEACDDYNRVRR